MYESVFSAATNHVMTTFAMEGTSSGLPVSQLGELQLQNRRSKLEQTLVFNRVCLFIASKLKMYQISKVSVIGEVLSIMVLVILTVICFSVVNFAIYKSDPVQFQFQEPPAFFTFVYYSFNNFVFSSTTELAPIRIISESAAIAEKFMALFLALILVSTLLSHKNQRQSEELSAAIRDIESKGRVLEKFMQDQFHVMTIEEAIAEI